MCKRLAKKVLLIGWDAADWKVIEPLMEQGKMPALKKLMEGGVYGRLQTLDPPLSPMLWTSIATGFRADKHGIAGFVEPNPDGSGLRPVTSTSRKVKAIWNILHQQGMKSNVISWWPSNPVEPINGVMVSNMYQVAGKPIEEEWTMSKGTIHPKSMEEEMKEWRVHPSEITLNMAIPFIPNLAENKKLRKDKRTLGVVKVIANAASVHAATTHLLEKTEWDLMAVYHDAIDHFSHLAMKYHPPLRPEINEEDYHNFNGVVEAGYRFHDMMLERTMELIDEDTTVVLISDHGFHSDHQRPLYIPQEPSGPAIEHSPYGIVVMAGPGIKKGGERISGASVIDITPTLLTLFGLPVGKDMEGRVLNAVFSENTVPEFIESWENVPGECGRHDEDLQEDPWEAQEALQQLVELGYIDQLEDNKLLEVEKAKRESQYYIARNLIDGKKHLQAVEILEKIYGESKIIRYGQRLAYTYLILKRLKQCQELIKELREIETQNFKNKKKELLEKDPNDPFGNKEMEEPMYLEFVEGLLYLQINRPKLALPILLNIQKKNPNNIQVAINIGKIHNSRKNFDLAEKQFIKALSIDEFNAKAHHGLGLAFLRRNMLEFAVEELLIAIECNFFMPNAHYHLGESLARAGYYKHAADAFEVAIRLAPGMAKAHKWLVDIYGKHLINDVAKKQHEQFLAQNIKGDITIVTGLPGSGYELILEDLIASGVEVFSEENQNEKENQFITTYMKSLHENDGWLGNVVNKVVYVAPQFLSFLPVIYNYKLVSVERELVKILETEQNKMGKKMKENTISIKHIQNTEKNEMKIQSWIDSQPTMNIIKIDFDEFEQSKSDNVNQLIEFITN